MCIRDRYYGPSFMIDDLIYHYAQGDQQTILINCHYPIDSNSFVLQYGIIVKKSATLPADVAMQTAIKLGDYVKLGFEPVSYTHLDVYKRQSTS